MTPHILLLLVGSGIFLLTLSVLTVIVMHVQKQEKRLALRVESVAQAYVPTKRIEAEAGSARLIAAIEAGPLIRKLAGLFGFNPDRTGHYPLRWWMVLPLTLVIGRIGAGLLMSLFGNLAWLVMPVAWVILSRAFFKHFDNRRTQRLYSQFPDALAMITRAVRVGIPVTESIRTVAREAVAPTTEEFQVLTDQITIGVPLEEGLRELAERNSLPEYRFFATALSLQSQTGGGLSETLDNLADVIRKRVALRARAYALASEARTSIIILSSLPVVAGCALAVLNREYINTLLFDPDGQKVLVAAMLSLGIGITIMKLIVKKSLS